MSILAYLFYTGDERTNDSLWNIKFYDKQTTICICNNIVPEKYKNLQPFIFNTNVKDERDQIEHYEANCERAIAEYRKTQLMAVKSKLVYLVKEEFGENIHVELYEHTDRFHRYWDYKIKYQDFPVVICDDNLINSFYTKFNEMENSELKDGLLFLSSESLYKSFSKGETIYPDWYFYNFTRYIVKNLINMHNEDMIVDGFRSKLNLSIPIKDMIILEGYNTGIIYIFLKYIFFADDVIVTIIYEYIINELYYFCKDGIFPPNTPEYIIKEKSLIPILNGLYKCSIKYPKDLNVVLDVYEKEFELDNVQELYIYLLNNINENYKVILQGDRILIRIVDSNLKNFVDSLNIKNIMFTYPNIKVKVIPKEESDENTISFVDSCTENIYYLKNVLN